MKPSRLLIGLSILVAVFAATAAGTGLFFHDDGQPFDFTTVHGETVRMNGQGLYRYDSFFKAPINHGTDAVVLFLMVPLLLVTVIVYARGSFRGKILLASVLSFFLYHAMSDAFGVAYNNLFLVYILYFSACIFACMLAWTSFDLKDLAARIKPGMPRRGMAIYFIPAGMTVFVWLLDIVSALSAGTVPPGLDNYTTDITAVIDVGIIAPLAFVTAVLLFRRKPLGYLIAPFMMMGNILIAVIVIGQTVYQASAGIFLSPGQMVGYVGSFVVMGLFALGLTIQYHRNIME